MTNVKWLTIALVLDLTLFFNLERLSFGESYYHFVNIQGFVYGVGVLAVIALIVFPPASRSGLLLALGACLAAYAVGKSVLFVSANHPALGGFNTFITIAEIALLMVSMIVAYALGRALRDFEQAVENITLGGLNHRLRNMQDADGTIATELARSRRHREPLSVIVVEPTADSVRATLNHVVEQVQRAMMTRYVMASMAAVMARVLRRSDMILQPKDRRRFIIVSPETDAANVSGLVRNIQANAARELDVTLRCGVAVFPHDALTFDELVLKAEENLSDAGTPVPVRNYISVESRQGS